MTKVKLLASTPPFVRTRWGLVLRFYRQSRIKDQLMRGEKIPTYLGVQMATLTPGLAQENNNDPNSPFGN